MSILKIGTLILTALGFGVSLKLIYTRYSKKEQAMPVPNLVSNLEPNLEPCLILSKNASEEKETEAKLIAKDLMSLRIALKNAKVSTVVIRKSWYEVEKYLLPAMQRLQEYKIQIRDLTFKDALLTLTDENLEKFSEYLSKLDELTSLNLNFRNVKHFSDRGMVTLSESLSNRQRLTSLTLDLQNVDQITNAGLSKLSGSLSTLSGLTSLSLKLDMIKQINNEGVSELGESLSHLNQLNSLNLSFKSNDNITYTDTGVGKLVGFLSTRMSLTSVNLDFKGCKKITDRDKEDMKDQLNACQNIQIE